MERSATKRNFRPALTKKGSIVTVLRSVSSNNSPQVPAKNPEGFLEIRSMFESTPRPVDRTISPNEGMFQGDEAHYFDVGAGAVTIIKLRWTMPGGIPTRSRAFSTCPAATDAF